MIRERIKKSILKVTFYSQGDEFIVACTYDTEDRNQVTFVSENQKYIGSSLSCIFFSYKKAKRKKRMKKPNRNVNNVLIF